MHRFLVALMSVVFLSVVQHGAATPLSPGEVVGKVVEITKGSVEVAVDGNSIVRPGDRVEIFTIVPNIEEEAGVAAGRVSHVDGRARDCGDRVGNGDRVRRSSRPGFSRTRRLPLPVRQWKTLRATRRPRSPAAAGQRQIRPGAAPMSARQRVGRRKPRACRDAWASPYAAFFQGALWSRRHSRPAT